MDDNYLAQQLSDFHISGPNSALTSENIVPQDLRTLIIQQLTFQTQYDPAFCQSLLTRSDKELKYLMKVLIADRLNTFPQDLRTLMIQQLAYRVKYHPEFCQSLSKRSDKELTYLMKVVTPQTPDYMIDHYSETPNLKSQSHETLNMGLVIYDLERNDYPY